jgi:hypothetical protein
MITSGLPDGVNYAIEYKGKSLEKIHISRNYEAMRSFTWK